MTLAHQTTCEKGSTLKQTNLLPIFFFFFFVIVDLFLEGRRTKGGENVCFLKVHRFPFISLHLCFPIGF